GLLERLESPGCPSTRSSQAPPLIAAHSPRPAFPGRCQALQRRVNYACDLLPVDDGSSLRQMLFRVLRSKPGRLSPSLSRKDSAVDLKQIGNNSDLAAARVVPQRAFGIEVRS